MRYCSAGSADTTKLPAILVTSLIVVLLDRQVGLRGAFNDLTGSLCVANSNSGSCRLKQALAVLSPAI